MKFLKTFFACFLAIFASIFVLFFASLLLIGIVVGTSSGGDVRENSVLYLPLEGNIPEISTPDIYNYLSSSAELSTSLQDILSAIDCAKTNPNIKGIYLKPGFLNTGYASLEEIRKSLMDFKTSGKFIVSYSGSYTQGGYYVATVADSLFLNPQGALDFRGVATSSMFYKHLLDTLGVDMQVIKVGTYKSFTEQYSNDSMSAPNREQTQQLVSSLWNTMLDGISRSRHISIDSLNSYADQMMAFQMPSVSLKNGMVDALRYGDQIETSLKGLLGISTNESVHLVRIADLLDSAETLSKESDNKIAVLYAYGEIDNGNTDGISSSKMVSELRKIAKDSTVKSLVIRVNSPGGSAYGAEQIWRAVELVRKNKPVVVSMGDYAASGGYYLSCSADRILADATTVTGSIGVFSVIPNAGKLMDKIGVRQEVVKTNPYADVLSNFIRPLDDTEKEILQKHVSEVYDVFLTRCSDGRKMDKKEVERVAEGRVWTGEGALKIGLVDQLGGLDDALKIAAELGGLDLNACDVVSFPEKEDVWSQLKELPHIGYERLMYKEDPFAKEKKVLYKIQSLDHDQAMMPFLLEVK